MVDRIIVHPKAMKLVQSTRNWSGTRVKLTSCVNGHSFQLALRIDGSTVVSFLYAFFTSPRSRTSSAKISCALKTTAKKAFFYPVEENTSSKEQKCVGVPSKWFFLRETFGTEAKARACRQDCRSMKRLWGLEAERNERSVRSREITIDYRAYVHYGLKQSKGDRFSLSTLFFILGGGFCGGGFLSLDHERRFLLVFLPDRRSFV